MKQAFIVSILSILFCLSLFNDADGQEFSISKRSVNFEILESNNGLKPGFISKAFRDKTGFLWIGTSINIQRYDGYNFVPINELIDSTNFKAENTWIQFVDAFNNIWINDKENSYQVFHQSSSRILNLDLPPDVIIKLDPEDNYWFYYNGEWKFISKQNIPENPDNLSSFSFVENWLAISELFEGFHDIPKSQHIYFDDNNISWITKNTVHSYKLDFKALKADFALSLQIDNSKQSQFEKAKIFANATNDNLYVCSSNSLIVIDLKQARLKRFLLIPKNLGPVWPEIIDSKDRLWMGSKDHGLLWLDPVKETIEIISYGNAPTYKNSILKYTRRFAMDYDNIVWLPTSSYGLLKYRLDTEKFKLAKDSTISYSMPALFPHPDGGVILESDNAIRFDPSSQSFTPLIDFQDLLPANFKLNYPRFRIDNRDNILMQSKTKRGRLFLKANAEGTIKEFEFNENEPDWFLGNYICHEGAKYWRYKGQFSIHRLDENHNVIDSFEFQESLPQNLLCNYYCSFDKFYFGFSSGLIITFDREEGRFSSYQLLDKSQNIDFNLSVNIIQKDTLSNTPFLWVGTNNGLFRINEETGNTLRLDSDDGLSDSYIYGILTDNNNHLWVSTNYGLMLMDPHGKVLQTFYEPDGIQDNEFNKRSFAKDKNGYFYFGGVGGLTYFKPEDFYKGQRISNTIISNYNIGDEVYPIRSSESNSNIIKPSIGYKSDLFGVDFAVLDLNNPRANNYVLDLYNHSHVTIQLEDQNNIDLLLLDPGDYTMEVKGRNSYAMWSESPATFSFSVLAPWYMTTAFKILAIVLATLSVFLLIYFRNLQKLKLAKLRNRIARDLHDEIGSTLTGISLFGTVALKSIDDQSKLTTLIEKMNESSQSATESINDIIWAIDTKNDTLDKLINRMRTYAGEIMDSGAWHFSFDYDQKLLEQEINMVNRRNVYLIFKEAVNNAIKYSGGDRIAVHISQHGNSITLSIKDNGQGFDLSSSPQNSLGGNGIDNMKRRAAELEGKLYISSAPKEGTEVILKFDINR